LRTPKPDPNSFVAWRFVTQTCQDPLPSLGAVQQPTRCVPRRPISVGSLVGAEEQLASPEGQVGQGLWLPAGRLVSPLHIRVNHILGRRVLRSTVATGTLTPQRQTRSPMEHSSCFRFRRSPLAEIRGL